ncbi:ribosomal protein L7/L12 [Nostoc sp. MG11]|uniref:ribosomal protein L7/L12 n=1 Tax=Nostoc sp. MG11 TaxID=2721166 RepID=UPI0039B6F586
MSKFQIRVISIGSKEAPCVKAIRLVTNLGAFDSALVSVYLRDHAPCVLVAGVSGEVAEHAANLLREAGAEVVVEASSIEAPIVLRPQADQRYRWHWFSGPTSI